MRSTGIVCSHMQRHKSMTDRTEHLSHQITDKQERRYNIGSRVGKEESMQENAKMYPKNRCEFEFRRSYTKMGQNYGHRQEFNRQAGKRGVDGHWASGTQVQGNMYNQR